MQVPKDVKCPICKGEMRRVPVPEGMTQPRLSTVIIKEGADPNAKINTVIVKIFSCKECGNIQSFFDMPPGY